jgi:hypothetical protein
VIISFDLAYVNMVPPAVVPGDPDATETLRSDPSPSALRLDVRG